MELYLSRPNVWAPLDSIANSLLAVLVPSGQATIPTEAEYLELLCQRVEWMIHQWKEWQEETEGVSAYALIDRELCRAGVYPFLPGIKEPPRPWSESVVLHNEFLHSKMGLHGDMDYPLPVLSDPAEVLRAMNLIEETYLEEWLTHLSAAY